jgi:hypothetical protein
MSMMPRTLEQAILDAERFAKKTDVVTEWCPKQKAYVTGPGQSARTKAAIHRASLDLTMTLADLRCGR